MLAQPLVATVKTPVIPAFSRGLERIVQLEPSAPIARSIFVREVFQSSFQGPLKGGYAIRAVIKNPSYDRWSGRPCAGSFCFAALIRIPASPRSGAGEYPVEGNHWGAFSEGILLILDGAGSIYYTWLKEAVVRDACGFRRSSGVCFCSAIFQETMR
jgi:hypothetical protein